MDATKTGLSVNFYAVGLPFNGETIKKKSLGGSESAAYYLGRELAKRGHRVTMWTSEKEEGESDDGVNYLWVGEHTQQTPLGDRFEQHARNTPHDVLIAQRGAVAFHRSFASKVNIWQLHDLALYRYASSMMGGMWQIDAVTTVSEFHKKQVEEVWNVNPDFIRVVRNGVDRSLYGQPMPGEDLEALDKIIGREPGMHYLLYQSRPERGLQHLVRPGGIMDRIRHLPVKLLLCGYENTVSAMAEFYDQLKVWAQMLPNVQPMGALTKQDLAFLQERCDLLLYPTEFEEVSCITAMEAMNAGLPMLSSACAALPETCANSGTILLPLKDGRADEDAFVAKLEDLFGQNDDLDDYDNREPGLDELSRWQRQAAEATGWELAGADLEELMLELLEAKTTVPRVLRHAIEHSDIDFANWVISNKVGGESGFDEADPISNSVFKEITELYAFTSDDHKYETHYRHHQNAYYNDFEDSVIGEDVTASTRFRGVLHFISESYNKYKADGGDRPMRVLDYGCAHGHYLMPLAKLFVDCEFLGVDISHRAIGAANKWKVKEQLTNVTFKHIDESWRAEGHYDVIIAAEVLEHVRDADQFLEQLRFLLSENGVMIFTTPTGRWEWTGTVPFRTGREHLRHYEKQDIEDLCGSNPHEILHAPAGHDQSAWALGSFVWAVQPKEPFGDIDYERKFARYAPRETVAACLIIRDGEKTLRKCVESFVDFVDEIHVYVDPLTKDRTLEIAKQLQEDFPYRVFNTCLAEKSATVDGFDEARNESISCASADWILWCDADEELRHADRMHMLLRPSMHNGYGFSQVHYSTDPEQVLTTDFPCRLFRNHRGAKFYGVVHEHPETEMGKSITWSLVRPEMKFLHAGYIDETTRRERYRRNLPLVLRDRKKFPNRELNRFLMIRDIAQGLAYEHQQTGGVLLPGQVEQAQEAIKLMEEMVDRSESMRMITDAMQYYSHCVATQGGGFDAEFSCRTTNDTAPDLAASLSVKGRFHSREFFQRVVNKFSQESTKLYEHRYL